MIAVQMMAWFAFASCQVVGVRLVKRRSVDDAARVGRQFSFHFEPFYEDSPFCDSGGNITKDDCRRAEEEIVDLPHMQAQRAFSVVEPDEQPNRLGGCYITASPKGWFTKYNPDFEGREIKHIAPRHVRICPGPVSQHQTEFFVLGDPGTSCEPRLAFEKGECLAAAFQLMLARGSHNLRYKDNKITEDGLGSNVPKGCSIRAGGAWAVHFNDSPDAVEANEKFSPVCGPHPSGVQQALGVTPADEPDIQPSNAVPPLPLPSNTTGSLAQRDGSTCDALSYATCCSKAQCTTCGSRRRHTRTFCPWYSDIVCCRLSSVCAC